MSDRGLFTVAELVVIITAILVLQIWVIPWFS